MNKNVNLERALRQRLQRKAFLSVILSEVEMKDKKLVAKSVCAAQIILITFLVYPSL